MRARVFGRAVTHVGRVCCTKRAGSALAGVAKVDSQWVQVPGDQIPGVGSAQAEDGGGVG